jgi:hypothetical protein
MIEFWLLLLLNLSRGAGAAKDEAYLLIAAQRVVDVGHPDVALLILNAHVVNRPVRPGAAPVMLQKPQHDPSQIRSYKGASVEVAALPVVDRIGVRQVLAADLGIFIGSVEGQVDPCIGARPRSVTRLNLPLVRWHGLSLS